MLQKMTKSGKLVTLGITQVSPNRYQPRRVFDEDALMELSESIRRHGLLQPVTVRAVGRGEYELVAGERRLRAAVMAGLTKIPALLVDMPDQEAAVMALVENLQRRDLDFFEEAEGLARLLAEQNLTQEQAAATLGKTQSTIANKLRLLKLDPGLRTKIRKAGLTERHARALLRLPEELREAALSRNCLPKADGGCHRQAGRPSAGAGAPRTERDLYVYLFHCQGCPPLSQHGGSRPLDHENSGIPAKAEMQERDSCYEYRILIPK